MAKLTLIPGQRVRHLKTGNIYVIQTTHHLHKVGADWIPSIVYSPENPSTETTYSRASAAFNLEFVNA